MEILSFIFFICGTFLLSYTIFLYRKTNQIKIKKWEDAEKYKN